MGQCSQCKQEAQQQGCNCGSLGCTVNLTDECITLKEDLDVCGQTIPAGTTYSSALQQIVTRLCSLM